MQRYLISFDDGAMDHIPAEDLPEVGAAARAVVQEAKNAGVWIFGAGIERQQSASWPSTVPSRADPYRSASPSWALSLLEVSSREQALEWAARLACACRCAQEVREIGYDPES